MKDAPIEPELKSVLKVAPIFSHFIETADNFLAKTIFRILAMMTNILESVSGMDFYAVFTGAKLPSSGIIKLDRLRAKLINLGFLRNFFIGDFIPDEPRIFIAHGKFGDLINSSDAGLVKGENDSGITGADLFSKEKAVARALGEAVERVCLGSYWNGKIIKAAYIDLGVQAINPADMISFSEKQLSDEKFSQFRFGSNTVFGWVKGTSLINGKKIMVPAQLVHLFYKKNHPEEPFIRFSISTGAAAHINRDEALYKSVCEVIERDAFMIFYLNKISPPRLDFSYTDDEEIQRVLKIFKRYRLEVYVMDITTDIPVPTYATVIIDRTGIGPAVVISTKSGLDDKHIILGSIAEAYKSWWARRRSLEVKPDVENIKKYPKSLRGLKERGLFWSTLDSMPKIEFFISGPSLKPNFRNAPYTSKERLKKSLDYFAENNMEVVSCDITIPEARRVGFKTYMTVIHKLQPLYLNEKYPYLGGERLYNIPVELGFLKTPKKESELNDYPHPHV